MARRWHPPRSLRRDPRHRPAGDDHRDAPAPGCRRQAQRALGGDRCAAPPAAARCPWRMGAGVEDDMARISYDEQTAAAFKAVREVPRDGLSEWREAVRRHLRPSQGMTLVDIGAGTGQFAAAFSDWFDLSVLAVEPSAAMRDQIPRTPAIQVLEGDASALPLPDASADAAWLSLVLHHIPDLGGPPPHRHPRSPPP